MTEKTRNFISGALLAVGAVFVGVGVYREETVAVLSKAVAVCLECIGIG